MNALLNTSDDLLGLVAWLAAGMVLLALFLAVFAFVERALIRERTRKINRLKGAWGDPVWRYLFGKAPSSTVWALVPEDDVLEFVAYLFPLVRRVDGEARQRLAGLVRPFLDPVRSELARRSPGRRAMAAEALGYFGEPEDLDRLLTALDDRSPLVAMVAARALTEWHGGWENARTILDSLERFQDWDTTFLATLVAELGPRAVPEFRRKFTSPAAPPGIRRVAAVALKILNDPGSADDAAEVLNTSTDRDLRAASMRMLGQVGNDRHVDSVEPYLDSKDFVLRVAAVDAFSRLSSRDELKRLARMVREDPSQWVAIHAARGLRDAGEVQILEELAISNHPRRTVALQAIMEQG